jgi:Ca2+-binding EF-hand superfamily protein
MIRYWGIEVTDSAFNELFNKLDVDGDGVISYKDFC